MKTRWGSREQSLAMDPDDFDLSDYTELMVKKTTKKQNIF